MTVDVASTKRSVEGWRELIVLMDSVLSLEKDWYLALPSGVLSVLFLLVWYQDPNMLTLLSVVGLVLTVLDYSVPRVLSRFYPEAAWTADKEKRLQGICHELTYVRTGVQRMYETVVLYKETSPLLYLGGVALSLFLLAQIGTMFSGFFLTYLTLLVLCLIPGLYRRGVLNKYCPGVVLRVDEFVKAKKLE